MFSGELTLKLKYRFEDYKNYNTGIINESIYLNINEFVHEMIHIFSQIVTEITLGSDPYQYLCSL